MELTDTFTYDGMNSSDFGFYASGEATFDAPEKEYDVFEIPGRNGDLEVFNGRFKNINVTYPCYYKKLGNDFAGDVARFRAALLSRDGYKRLYDTHHPEYYRLGICKSALVTNPTEHDLVASLDVAFDCKPQRFLTSGEAPVSVASGDAITNPTSFKSSPLLMVAGYGGIVMNGHEMSVIDGPIGDITVANMRRSDYGSGLTATTTRTIQKTALMNSGDKIYIAGSDASRLDYVINGITDYSQRIGRHNLPIDVEMRWNSSLGGYSLFLSFTDTKGSELYFQNGTAETLTDTITLETTFYGTEDIVVRDDVTVTLAYNGTTVTMTLTASGTGITRVRYVTLPKLKAYATKGTLGEPLYLDCETGEAYKYEGDEYVSINSAVWLGAELPTLTPGINAVSYDQTITSFQIVPRWWTI